VPIIQGPFLIWKELKLSPYFEKENSNLAIFRGMSSYWSPELGRILTNFCFIVFSIAKFGDVQNYESRKSQATLSYFISYSFHISYCKQLWLILTNF
jgi:hypothetical protein